MLFETIKKTRDVFAKNLKKFEFKKCVQYRVFYRYFVYLFNAAHARIARVRENAVLCISRRRHRHRKKAAPISPWPPTKYRTCAPDHMRQTWTWHRRNVFVTMCIHHVCHVLFHFSTSAVTSNVTVALHADLFQNFSFGHS